MPRRLLVDFDGVVHRYSRGWQDGRIYDPPTDGASEGLAALAALGDVVIFTTRANTPEGQRAVWDWLGEHGLDEHVVSVTDVKLPASILIDDRAHRFEPDHGPDGAPAAWTAAVAATSAQLRQDEARRG